jgi:hypothetical protein
MSIFGKQDPDAVAIRELPEREICFRSFRTLERETFGNVGRIRKRPNAPGAWNESPGSAMIERPTSNLSLS